MERKALTFPLKYVVLLVIGLIIVVIGAALGRSQLETLLQFSNEATLQ